MKIKISADSTCDLSPELIQKYDISIMPLYVALGENNLVDGVTIYPQDIYDYYAENKKLPKTGARSAEEYEAFFAGELTKGYDAIVHFTISADMSASYNDALLAAQHLENVYVVDSRNLSTGIGLLVLDACDCAAKGMQPKNICERVNSRAGAVQASFIIESLEFLHKGGRCSSLSYFGANLLRIRPCIIVADGKMGVWKKMQGKYPHCVEKYVDAVRESYTNPDKTRCFVTHTKMDAGITENVIEIVKSWNIFDEILDTTAGCTVTTHCGENTIGVLFINDGGVD